MTFVPTQNPGLTGAVPSPVAASPGGDTFLPGTRVHVLNGGGAPVTATILTPGTVRGLAIADQPITIQNGTGIAGCKFFDCPTGDLYADPITGLVSVTWSATASVTFWVEGAVLS